MGGIKTLTEDEVSEIFSHLKQIENIMKGDTKPFVIDKACPRCGKKLVRRFTRRDGKPFIGCSGYPECSHAESIDTVAVNKDNRPDINDADEGDEPF